MAVPELVLDISLSQLELLLPLYWEETFELDLRRTEFIMATSSSWRATEESVLQKEASSFCFWTS